MTAVNPWVPSLATIRNIKKEAPGVQTYELELASAEARAYHFQAGQFNMLYLPGIGEAAISMSSDPGEPNGPRTPI
jgi:NAD(P)H-flavin reductase